MSTGGSPSAAQERRLRGPCTTTAQEEKGRSYGSLRRVLDVVGDESPDRRIDHQPAPHLRVKVFASHELRHELDRFECLLGKLLVAVEPLEPLAQCRDSGLRHTR